MWKNCKFEFNSELLEKSQFNQTDVYYIIRLCCYENEQHLKFKVGNSNNRVHQKEVFKIDDVANKNGGLWLGNIENNIGVDEKEVNVECEVAGWQKFGHGLRHIFASEQ